MGTESGTGRSAGRVDFRSQLTPAELSGILEDVRRHGLHPRRAARLISPDATEADVTALAAEMLDWRRAA